MSNPFEPLAAMIELPDALMYGVSDATYAILRPVLDPFTALVGPTLEGLMKPYIGGHEMSKRLPLMNPSSVAFGLVGYAVMLLVLFVVGKALGKLSMKTFMAVHNLFLFALSLYMCVAILITALASGFTLWNNHLRTGVNGWRMAKLVWLFYASKLPEFLDTAIMVLKQNYRQVSVLHLYHHSTIFVIWFIVVFEAPGGEAYFSAMLNSGVHVIMYGYYFTTIVASERMRKALDKYKYYITFLQMTQFLCNVFQSAYDLYVVDPKTCGYPRYLIQLLFFYMLTLLALFGNFLVQNMGKKKKDASDKAAKAAEKKHN